MKEIEFISTLDNYDQNRIRVHLTTENGDLKDIMYQYETLFNNKWIAIVRYDCAHGFFSSRCFISQWRQREAINRNGFIKKRIQICRARFERQMGMIS
jgi:hypothetical protein